MSNKYCNLPGGEKISETFGQINDGFASVETDIESVETDIEKIDQRVDELVNNPDPNKDLELVDLRNSNIYGVFPTAKARSDNIDNLFSSHLAETTSELISYNRALPGVNETVIIILSENRTPKRIDVRVAAYDIETRKTMSIGSWEQNRQDCIACVGNTGGFVRQNNYASSLIDTWGGAMSTITIQNVRQGAFDIAITAISGGSAGSYNFQFVVHYHD